VTLSRDDWSKVRAAAGRLPLRRSVAPRALVAAWRALDAALRACPPGRRVLALDLALGEHVPSATPRRRAPSRACAPASLPRCGPMRASSMG
jgi:hypothetical protein